MPDWRPQSAAEWEQHFKGWGNQTIMYAFSVKGRELGRELNPAVDPEFCNSALRESERISRCELWDEAVEISGPEFSDAVGMTYCQLVLDWCAKHLGYSKPSSKGA